jgi:hypothetical protein
MIQDKSLHILLLPYIYPKQNLTYTPQFRPINERLFRIASAKYIKFNGQILKRLFYDCINY